MDAPVSLNEGMDFVVVLVRPKGAGNVGSIARTMGHFGLDRLRLVSPLCDAKSLEARSMAMGAQPLLAVAGHYATLRDATSDCGWIVATSRRLGRKRRPTLDARKDAGALLRRAEKTRVAIVFGQEDKGLFTEEMDLSQELLLIPALPGGESYNLSQAVLLVLWELFMAKQERTPARPAGTIPKRTEIKEPASREEVEGLVDHLVATFEEIGFVPHHNPTRVARTFRSLLDRTRPDTREVRIMRGVLSQLSWKVLRGREGEPPPEEDRNGRTASPLPPDRPGAGG